MGTVYKARDPRLNRFVALKFIRDNTSGSELAQRFYREARSQAGIEHEYVCKIYEVGGSTAGRTSPCSTSMARR